MSDVAAVVPRWSTNIYRLYLVSFIAWAVGTGVLLIADVLEPSDAELNLMHPFVAVLLMLCGLPGMLYFFLQSRKLRSAEPQRADTIMHRIMVFQHVTGVAAIVGAVLGLLPFLVNVSSFVITLFTMTSLADWLMWLPSGLAFMIPWVSLYGFVATYIVAMVIYRQRRRSSR